MSHLTIQKLMITLCIVGVESDVFNYAYSLFSHEDHDFASYAMKSEYQRKIECVGQRRMECCKSKGSFKQDIKGLRSSMKDRLYGQPMVAELVPKLLENHLENDNPVKALVLSFHGGTGTGKNFVTSLIAEHINKGGRSSNNVHSFSACDFPDIAKLNHYKDDLRHYIGEAVKKGHRNQFIFDKVDKMPNGLLNAVRPFLGRYSENQGGNSRKSIFIFISGTGTKGINEWSLKQVESGRGREGINSEMFMSEMGKPDGLNSLLRHEIFNEPGGLFRSSIVEEYLISAYLPFLPLERCHVTQCIQNHVVTDTQMKRILDELMDFPLDSRVFSGSGCKLVKDYVVKYRCP